MQIYSAVFKKSHKLIIIHCDFHLDFAELIDFIEAEEALKEKTCNSCYGNDGCLIPHEGGATIF